MQNHLNLFSSLPTLRTKRLTLRPVRMSDAADLYEYSKDPEVARHVLWDAHTSIHQTRSYLRFLIRQYRAGQPSTFVIVWNENRKAIGTIGFMWVQQENRSAEVGLPSVTATSDIPLRVALADRQLPAPFVVPVFSPVVPG